MHGIISESFISWILAFLIFLREPGNGDTGPCSSLQLSISYEILFGINIIGWKSPGKKSHSIKKKHTSE